MGPIRETGVPVEADPIRWDIKVLTDYLTHYHAERNHQGKHNLLLFPARADISPPANRIVGKQRLGGLLKYYTKAA
jgi:putative transposase